MRSILKLLGFLKPLIWQVVLSILLGIAAVAAGIGMLGTSAFLIASAALHPSIADLQVAIVGVRFFGISRAVFRYLERLVSHSVNLKVLSNLREWFYRQIEAAPPAVLYTHKSGDLLNRVMADLETLENFYVRVVAPIFMALVVGTGVSFFLGTFNASLGLCLAAGLIFNGFVLPVCGVLATHKSAKEMITARAEISAQTVEWIQGLAELQAAGVQDQWLKQVNQKSRQAGEMQLNLSMLSGINSGLGLLLLNLTVVGLLWIAIPLVTAGSISGVSLAVILLMGMASFESVGSLPQAALMLNASLESAERLLTLNPSGQPKLTGQSLSDGGSPTLVSCEHISFEYADDQAFALCDVSFELRRGRKLALIGPSGAGKTSLVNLLLQFWQPTDGMIKIGGIPAGELDPYRVRALFGVVSQHTWLFSSSLRQNLLLADPRADDQKLLWALQKAELADWAARLPQGLDTWLGDQGVRLSGGERQRLSVARVLLQDRPFLLLDEPVENLDPVTAGSVLESVFDLFNDRGILMITHDFSHLERLDEILLLEEGRVSERGKFAALLANRQRFAALYDLFTQTLKERTHANG